MSVSNTTKRVKEIRRNTRHKFSSEEKIRIVLEGLRGECSIAELCRCEGINANLYYRWSKDFLEAGKKRLAGDTVRGPTRVPQISPASPRATTAPVLPPTATTRRSPAGSASSTH
jgi:transposase-like protein